MSKNKPKKSRLTAKSVTEELIAAGNSAIAEHSQRFFKTGKGEYGAGDRFLGIRMPVLRKQVTQSKEISLEETLRVLKSPYHEVRMVGALLLVQHFRLGDELTKHQVYEEYLAHTKYINNWDLVDCSAHLIVGPWLEGKSHQKLKQLALSNSLWERRIAMMANFHFIRHNDFDTALTIATLLLNDKEDLIHKIVGWMLREIGNRDRQVEESFLKQHYKAMPRTMLRYAIEKFPEPLRKDYLQGRV